MIKARSTYKITYNLDLNFDVIVKIYIWGGDINIRTLEPVYSITDTNPTGIAQRTMNIAPLVLDFISSNPVSSVSSGLVDFPNTINVSVDREVNAVATTLITDTVTRGYYNGFEGQNIGLPTNKILMQGDYMKASRTGSVLIPLVPDNTNVVVVSSPLGEFNTTLAVATSDRSEEAYKGFFLNCSEISSDTEVLITYNSESYLIEIVDEPKYEPIDIFFINKEGMLQSFTFFKERKEKTNVNKEMYQRSGVSVSSGEHQYAEYNLNGKTTFSVNSGFVEEVQNETFRQMLLSERIWAYDGTSFMPLNIDSSNIDYRTQVNDKLIKYTIDFSYSFDDIQTL